MKCNYHTHTYRCHHATGGEREYIENAISGGIRKLGFSDHIPFVFPDGYESAYRISFSDCDDYISTLRKYREEYRNKIEIRIGFEMEYYPKYFDGMFKVALNAGAEYLILGQHFLNNEHPNGHYCGFPSDSDEGLHEYVDCVIAGINTGVFTYVAHPDLFNYTGGYFTYEKEMRRLCAAAAKADIPLEINLLGIRTGRNYPNPTFWRIAGEECCKAVFGFDAHTAKDAFDAKSIPIAERLANECGLLVVDDPKIVDISVKQ